ncbi:hypothetical protein KF728_18270 [Candidatus Obscuribacterales bacterium]|nr:hypothetical protein [Candidatus Obscuribacterales bacterium]
MFKTQAALNSAERPLPKLVAILKVTDGYAVRKVMQEPNLLRMAVFAQPLDKHDISSPLALLLCEKPFSYVALIANFLFRKETPVALESSIPTGS